jgi:c-di-GMP-binding flagellar brake protein YcgR
MAYEDVDRRKHRRAYFSISDNIAGKFILDGETEIAFNAPILNFSSGGLHFSLNKSRGIVPKAGDELRLVKIEGEAALDFEFNIALRVKWILEHESLSHSGYGCEFIHISKPDLDRISQFIDFKYVGKTVK